MDHTPTTEGPNADDRGAKALLATTGVAMLVVTAVQGAAWGPFAIAPLTFGVLLVVLAAFYERIHGRFRLAGLETRIGRWRTRREGRRNRRRRKR